MRYSQEYPSVIFLTERRPDATPTWKDDLLFALRRQTTVLTLPLTSSPDAVESLARTEQARSGLPPRVVWPLSYFQEGPQLRDILTIGVTLDAHVNVPGRHEIIGRSPWWHCRYLCTPDGDPSHYQTLTGHNPLTRHVWFPPAAGAEDFLQTHLFPPPIAYRYQPYTDVPIPQIVFVGQRRYPLINHAPRREALLAFLEHAYPSDSPIPFTWFGPGSPHGEAWGADARWLYQHARVIIGDGSPTEGTHWCHNRVPLVLAALGQSRNNGVLIMPDIPGVTSASLSSPDPMYRLTTRDNDIITYQQGDFHTLRQLIDAKLAIPAETVPLFRQGYSQTTMRHTYHDRARLIRALV